MRKTPVLWFACAVMMSAVSSLSGCVTSPFRDVLTGQQTRIKTDPPYCPNAPHSLPAVQGSNVEVLKAAFKRVRAGTPMPLTEPGQTLVQMAPTGKVGAPVLHVEVDKLVKHDKPGYDVPAASGLLQAAKGLKLVNANPVAQELAKRIPWLTDGSEAYVIEQSKMPGADQAAKAGLDLIKLMIDKKATLLSTGHGERTTTFGPADQATMRPSLQQFAGFEPFRLVTLLVAGQIINELNDAEQKETPRLIALVATFNASVFLATYFDGYFRAGQFVQVSVNQASLENDVIQQFDSKLKAPLTDDAKQQLRQAVANVCANPPGHCTALPSLGSEGFTSLFGQSVQFGGISIAFNGASPNAPWRPLISAPSVGVLGPQMMQVLVEALFDANGPHPPGLMTSTACARKLFQDDDGNGQCVEASQAGQRWESINRVGNATQALVTTGVGALIRGGSIAALNNEAVATTVETFAGVTVRKAVQQVMWVCRAPTTVSVDAP